ncbi:hypothetical protein [Baekduia soli]|uniref:hypothetical protein n=1 Tax=Baekduia soli TaxID=496014 RepID=UPI001652989F|nr:hypothetical protein [Baekduia soli]
MSSPGLAAKLAAAQPADGDADGTLVFSSAAGTRIDRHKRRPGADAEDVQQHGLGS